MRIDKYLWCVRNYKTQILATIACKKGNVIANSDTAKPNKEIFISYKTELRKNQINYKLTINNIPSIRVGDKLVENYRTNFTPKEQFKAQELLKYSKDYYRKKGVGRPTKKDRRDISDFNDENE